MYIYSRRWNEIFNRSCERRVYFHCECCSLLQLPARVPSATFLQILAQEDCFVSILRWNGPVISNKCLFLKWTTWTRGLHQVAAFLHIPTSAGHFFPPFEKTPRGVDAKYLLVTKSPFLFPDSPLRIGRRNLLPRTNTILRASPAKFEAEWKNDLHKKKCSLPWKTLRKGESIQGNGQRYFRSTRWIWLQNSRKKLIKRRYIPE